MYNTCIYTRLIGWRQHNTSATSRLYSTSTVLVRRNMVRCQVYVLSTVATSTVELYGTSATTDLPVPVYTSISSVETEKTIL